ncbi:MAG TPA: ATP-binding cassette domain-containing protein, partial [Bacillota bacterium]|nr:ATP-binding cassette domain-containing protein [Bacillota bacterium]
TIANNIRIGRPDATDEEVLQVAEQAQLTPLIESLPKGIHTNMLELGERFSGGERQRIAFARVLLQDTPILIVDEATIGLDPLTEYDLIDTILEATTDKTVIWITHHLAGAAVMDEVIFLEDGVITMQGSHQELMKRESKYKRLYEMDQTV